MWYGTRPPLQKDKKKKRGKTGGIDGGSSQLPAGAPWMTPHTRSQLPRCLLSVCQTSYLFSIIKVSISKFAHMYWRWSFSWTFCISICYFTGSASPAFFCLFMPLSLPLPSLCQLHTNSSSPKITRLPPYICKTAWWLKTASSCSDRWCSSRLKSLSDHCLRSREGEKWCETSKTLWYECNVQHSSVL